MSLQHSGSHEAVFFMAGGKVTKRMLFSEFEAMLDGLGTLPEYADSPAFAVFAVISKTGKITSLVFFKIHFDGDGRADSSWNIPVERLSEISGEGPDLGDGPIRLACRAQCAINWHQNELWDPDPSGADFEALRATVEENRLRLVFEKEPEEIPVLDAVGDSDLGHDMALEAEQRVKLARLLKEQRLRIRSLELQQNTVEEDVDREQRIIVQAYKNEIQELNRKVEQLRVSNEHLQDKLSSRNEQFIDLQDKVTGQAELVADLEDKLKHASAGEREQLEKQKLEAEMTLLREQLDRKDMDLAYRDEREDQLLEELDELKSRLRQAGGTGVFETLKALDIVYVAYHPGAGHISMSANEVTEYAVNPIEFVAAKCSVTEEIYTQWLDHFENPACTECATPIEKVAFPNEFQPGSDDRCSDHKLF